MGWPVIGESLSFIKEFSSPSGIYSFMNKRQQRYGKVFKTSVLGRFTVFMTGREASRILLSGKDGVVSLNLFYTGQQVLGPTSLLQTTGEEHKRLRRLIGEPLSLDALKNYFRFINELAVDTLDGWLGQTVLVLEEASTKHTKEAEMDKEDEEKLTDKQLKDNILTLLVAGHDTTTAALTWLIMFLGENPDVLQNLRDEHMDIQSRYGGTGLTWAEVNNMPYTIKVINETLRRATILPWFSRKAAQDFKIDGLEIKKGWSVNLDVVSIHHDPEVFPDPENFDPSRFDKPLKSLSFLGFGSGPRMCPGINLAKLEICVFIHHLVCKYKWRPLQNDNAVQPTLVRMPKNKYPIVVEPL
ncbi:Abscisic acid 8'-hydroxylase 2 [Acorus calamus]|uniref:Abscisic acid 8'-hydroxylase 2 n=1 Tax=Acorus calamus TaxID=4465 RepID=A0AAV9DJD3_ACOCL|nr:Abscisic acid 8'-hydroxylase 2 [Acorus calamus]